MGSSVRQHRNPALESKGKRRTAIADELLRPEVVDADHFEPFDARTRLERPLQAVPVPSTRKHLAFDPESLDSVGSVTRVGRSGFDRRQERVEAREGSQAWPRKEIVLSEVCAAVVDLGERGEGPGRSGGKVEDSEDELWREGSKASGRVWLLGVHFGRVCLDVRQQW